MLLVALPASAGVPDIDLRAAKAKSGPFNESVRRNVPFGEKRNVFLRARNLDEGSSDGALLSLAAEGDYRFKYFKPNGTQITDKVADEGHFFTLAEGGAKKFRMQIKAKTGTTEECVGPQVAFSGGDDRVPVMINFPPDLFCVLV
jgi:hypothetical protein